MQIVSKKFYTFLTLTPLIAIGLFYSVVVRAYFVTNRWPTPYNPDPRTLNFDVHGPLAFIVAILALTAIPPWLIVTVLSYYKKSFSKKLLLICCSVYGFELRRNERTLVRFEQAPFRSTLWRTLAKIVGSSNRAVFWICSTLR